jgi:hypothetical protein
MNGISANFIPIMGEFVAFIEVYQFKEHEIEVCHETSKHLQI